MTKVTGRIEYNDEDKKFLKEYIDDVQQTLELVIQMFGNDQHLLLSNLFRDLVKKNAERTLLKHRKIKMHLNIDNTGNRLWEESNND